MSDGKGRPMSYGVDFSQADGEWVGTCAAYPSLSHLAPTREAATLGIVRLVEAVEADNHGTEGG